MANKLTVSCWEKILQAELLKIARASILNLEDE